MALVRRLKDFFKAFPELAIHAMPEVVAYWREKRSQ